MTTIDSMVDQIQEDLTQLFMKYDTKLLATAMLMRSATALRTVHSAGIWKVSDVQAVVEAALEDIYTPIPAENLPPVARQTSTVMQ